MNAGALLGRLGPGIFQQAWVVADLEAAKDAMATALGCDGYTEFVMAEQWDLRGRTVECSLGLAFGRSGDMQVELMQPLEGEGVQMDFLQRRGAGFHHLGVLVDDLDEEVAAATTDGFPALMTGQFSGVRICFLDTFEALGFHLELIEDPNRMLWATRPWRDHPLDP